MLLVEIIMLSVYIFCFSAEALPGTQHVPPGNPPVSFFPDDAALSATLFF